MRTSMRAAMVVVVASCAIVHVAQPVAAQDAATQPAPADERVRRQAREAFTSGERAFEKGDYVAALAAFERAFALAPHDAVRFNLAVCLERLGRPSEALLQYEAAAKSSVLTAAERERARRSGAELRPKVGTLVVEGQAGAAVQVDGRS